MNPVSILTGMALRKSGGAIADSKTVTTACSPTSRLPLVLPQERWHSDAPFVRASSTALPLHPVDVARAIDGVNEALLTSPRATAVKVGSFAAGLLVPGLGTVTAAALGTGAHITGAMDRAKAVQAALNHANLIFVQADLRASILNTAQLHEFLGLPPPCADALLAGCVGDDEEDARDDVEWGTEAEKGRTEGWSGAEGEGGNGNDPKEAKEKGKEKKLPLPLGLERLRPYAAFVLPADIDLGPAKYTHEGRTDGLSNLAARGQVAKSSWNERRGASSRGGRKRTRLVRDAIWFVVV